MSKVAVVYWSGTGNTEIMANKVAEGAKAGGAEVEVFEAEGFSADKMDEFDAVAFACPSMGCEELEDTIFEPMFASCESKLQEWMQNWEETCKNDGASLACDSVICNETPDDEAEANCVNLGKALA